jgi:hypothetical protein
MYVAIAKRLDAVEIQEREEKEQKMIELTIQARANGESVGTPIEKVSEGFGSSLENDEFVNRARSRTASEDFSRGLHVNNDIHLLRQLSLSSEDRLALEREMRAQHTHPLAIQMDAEEEERRTARELEYYRNNPQRTSEAAMLRSRMVGNESFRNRISRMNPDSMRMLSSRSGRRTFQDFSESTSMDDMVVLEAALLLSMEEEARSNGGASRFGLSSDLEGSLRRFRGSARPTSLSALMDSATPHGLPPSLSEEEELAMAIALSMQEQQGPNGEKGANADEKNSDVARVPPESAPSPKPASGRLATGVASLPVVSEDEIDFQEVEEEQQAKPLFDLGTARLKCSDDDSAYFESLATNVDETTAAQNFTQQTTDVDEKTAATPITRGGF